MRVVLHRLRRLLSWLVFIVLLVAAIVTGVLWLTLPPRSQQARIAGLSGPVDIGFDADGIPRIRAVNDTDAAAALGFVHARDRLFQMELMRRAASGRLSEIAGPATLALDRSMRTFGLRRHAVAEYPALPAETRAMLEAYSRGVNAWIAERGRLSAPEALFLGTPEPWEPVDSLLWGETMGLWLSLNWRTELSRQALAGRVPQQMVDELWPPAGGAGRPEAALEPGLRQVAGELAALLPRFPDLFTLPGSASNEWAVDGRHTATGAPLLAGDPHLAFGFPAIWYLARIETRAGVLAGATAPGVPFLVLGHNGHIAWSFTTTGADVQDLFIETAAGDGQYQTPDGPRPFAVREERIKVRGEPDQILAVRETRHGPVVSDLRGSGGPILAAAMANLAPGNTAAAGLFALNQARDVDAAGKAAAMITAPVQNLVVADRQRIALYVTGRVPIRRAGDGSAPVPGDGSHDWIGWASGEQLPHVVAPASGRLVNANDRIAPSDFPVFLGRDWFGDWRAARIRELLSRSDRHTAGDFARMQVDVHSGFARQILPTLLARAGHRGHRPARPGAATRLGRQHDGGRAAAADLQRLGAPPLWPRPATGQHLGERRRPAGGIRRIRAVPCRRAVVWRRLHRHASGGTGRGGGRPHRPLRQRSCTVALGRGPSGRFRPSAAAPVARSGRVRHALHPKPRRRHDGRSRRACIQTVSIGARSGVSRRL